MNNILTEYSLFLLEWSTIIIGIVIVLSTIAKQKICAKTPTLTVTPMNDHFHNYHLTLLQAVGNKKALKKANNNFKKQQKLQKKNPKQVFVINFHGDIVASKVKQLGEMVSAIITMGDNTQEVILTLESTGGLVHAYGLAALQLQRLRNHNIPLTICIDKVAASGGYMMAVHANKVIAAPFAIIGSIGVAAEMPNFHRLLKKHAIDYEQITAGEFKRTLSTFGENTGKGRKKMQEDINQAHELFKNHVKTYRSQLDVDKVATGEVWFGQDALERQLIDQLMTSQDYILTTCQNYPVFAISMEQKKSLGDKISKSTKHILSQAKQTLQQQSQDEGMIR